MGTLMIQGTTSDAGKSALATALCRLLYRNGVAVAPFKPQNMALNSAVTVEGGEIGRAQAVQAQASGLEPQTDMNPVLLKPNSETGAQVIIDGRAIGNMDARSYHAYKPQVMQGVLAAHTRLRSRYASVIVEGAGSPAEINLRQGDIANMGFAEAVDCPVILIADIDRGGVFAHLLGTLELLSESERARVCGLVINRFRGDRDILQPGIDWLEQRTGLPVLGVLPHVADLHLEAEDSLSGQFVQQRGESRALRVVAPRTPRVCNHTDLDPLRLHPQVDLHFAAGDAAIPAADLIVLLGSKSVRSDLTWLRAHGWASHLARHLRYGGKVLGICGGLQVLGTAVHDPHGKEGPSGSSAGFAWLNLETTLHAHDKQLHRVSGHLALPGEAACSGYEIHTGQSTGPALAHCAVRLNAESGGRMDGAISADGQIMATYLHGIFDRTEACAALLAWAGLRDAAEIDYEAERERHIDRWADIVAQHIDWPKLAEHCGEFSALTP